MYKTIAVIGPESTGKSTLCKQLADHYKTAWVPEFAREYLEKNGMDYSYDTLLTIAKGQADLEEEYINTFQIKNSKLKIQNNPDILSINHSQLTTHNSLLFIDTEMYVMKVWCEFVFDKCHNWILNQIAARHYDLYLLCNIDLAWVKDNLREYPDYERRARLYCYYKDIMVNQATPWIDISGDYEQRLAGAIKGIDSVIF